jgi:hypothetical protein
MSSHLFGPANPNFRGGKTINSQGYVTVLAPHHPRAHNGRVREHILVAEAALGRYLPDGAQVHHVDENKQRNVGGNLVICPDQSYHSLLHRRTRAYEATGNANAIRCIRCHTYDRQDDIAVYTNRGTHPSGEHRSCHAAAVRASAARRKLRAPTPSGEAAA